jgi:hypothetical protein
MRFTLMNAVIAGVAIVLTVGCSSSLDEANRAATTVEQPRVVTYGVPRTPQSTVLLLRRLSEAHLFLTAVDLYEPRIINVIGRDNLIGLLGAMAPTVGATDVLLIEKQRVGREVALVLRGRIQAKPVLLSYVLRPHHGQWKVLYDSMINDSLGAYIQAQFKAKFGSGTRKLRRRAKAAGTAAVLKYQRAVIASGAPIPRR